jgi:hypothetical protein
MSRNLARVNWLRVKDQMLLISLLCALPAAASADAYKPVTEASSVEYNDRRVPESECEKIETRNDENCTAIAERKRRLDEAEKQADLRIEERQKQLAAEQAAREARLAKQQQCFDARKQLVVLQTQMPVYRDSDGQIRAAWKYDTYIGEREYLDAAARAKEVANTNQLISTLCQRPDDAAERAIARKQWLRSERCAAARSQLEILYRSQAKSAEQAIEDKLQEIDHYCKDE